MRLDPQQRHVVNTIISVGRRRGVSRTEMLAALDTAGAEANFGNPSHGDGSSVGWRQETASSYPNVNRMDVQASVNRFFNETNAYLRSHGKTTPGVLAQGVQRSAYPARYRQFTGLAGSLLRGSGVTGASGSGGGTPARNVRVTGRAHVGSQQIASMLPGDTGLASQIASEIASTQQVHAPTAPLAAPSFSASPKLAGGLSPQLQSGGPAPKSTALTDALLQAATDRGPDVSLSVPGASSTVSGTVHIPGRRGARGGAAGGGSVGNVTALKGTANFGGKTVAAWIKPALEYARHHGWKGSVNSGYRSYAHQLAIWNSGVRPAARPGTSNHEGTQFPRGAVDVSQAQQLSNILKNSPYGHLLQWAGGKDPVHFSHPVNGRY